jgi:hypothetical protein
MGRAKTSVHHGFISSQLSAPSLLKLSPFQIWPAKQEVQKQLVERSFSSSYKGCSGWGNSPVRPKAKDATSWHTLRLQRWLSIGTPPAMSTANRQPDLYAFFTVPMAQEWRSPHFQFSSTALVGSTWTAVMTNNPSCVEPGNSLSPNPQLLLLLSQVDQDECPPLCPRKKWASFFSWAWEWPLYPPFKT